MHTPTPVRSIPDCCEIFDTNGAQYAKAYTPEIAAHIVKCVNLHDELVAFIKRYTIEAEASGGWDNDDDLFTLGINIVKRAEAHNED